MAAGTDIKQLPMKQLAHQSWLSKMLPLTVAWMIVGTFRLTEIAGDDSQIRIEQLAAVEVVRSAPAPTPAEKVKPAKKAAQSKEASRLLRLKQPIYYPAIYPNPLAFNMTWTAITDKTFAQVRALANRQRVAIRRAAVVRRPLPNAAAQNAIQQQMRRFLEPMLKAELSFAARATDLNRDERRKLAADGKAWFEKFLAEYLKKQNPNQQQMLVQGMQGVWFGNGQPQVESPREAIRAGVAKLVKGKLPKEKVAAYTDECRKRDEFARQVSIENLVERIDEKVKLSPDQWKKITKTLTELGDKSRDPQLEAFAINRSMWPGAPNQWVLPELSPAQQAVLKGINNTSGQIFINGGIFGPMFGGNVDVIDDMDVEVQIDGDQPAAVAVPLNLGE